MKVTEHERVKQHVGIAKRLGKPATLTLSEWKQTIADFGGLCAYCLNNPFELLEHFIPIRFAGTHVRNCVPACNDCNRKKKDYTGDKLIEKLGLSTVQRITAYLESQMESDSTSTPIPVDTSKPYTPKTWTVTRYTPSPDDEYFPVDYIAQSIGKSRGTVLNYIKLLNITKHKFPQDSRTYVSVDDVKRIKTVIEKPWMAEQLKNKPEQSERSSPVEGVA